MTGAGTVADGDATATLLAGLERLDAILERETACLLAGEAEAVLDLCTEKEAVFAEVERMTASLRGVAPGPATEAWFEQLEPDPVRRAELRRAVRRCAERNLANGRILARLRRSNDDALAVLTGREARTLGYAAGGAALREGSARSLARA